MSETRDSRIIRCKALLDRRSFGAFAVGFSASILAACSECAFSVILIGLLAVIGHANLSELPGWFPRDPDFLTVKMLLFSFLLCGCIRALAQLAHQQCNHVALESVRLKLRLLVGDQLLAGEDGKRPHCLSHINLLMNELIGKAADYVFCFLDGLAYCSQVLIVAAAMFYFAWVESLVGLLCLVVLGAVSLYLKRRLQKVSKQIADRRERLERNLVRVSRNWLLIRILGLRHRELGDFKSAATEYCNRSLKGLFMVNCTSVLPQFSGTVAVCVVLLVSLSLKQSSSADLLAFLYLFSRFVHVLTCAMNKWIQMAHYRYSFDQATADLLIDAPEVPVGTERGIQRPLLTSCAPELVVDNLSYAHDSGDGLLFDSLSFEVKAGTHFGIVGPNGSGKSTLMALLLGVYKPECGIILIDGQPAVDVLHSGDGIAYVGPDPFLIGGTIRENLLYGSGTQLADTDLWEALRNVRLAETIELRALGLDSVIREGGDGFSYGEKQRISLARALLRDPRILALDEASANLDNIAEGHVSDLLSKMTGKVTIISVSNKPGILASCDAILDLSDMTVKKGPG